MKHPRALLLIPLAVPALLAFAYPETKIVFGIESGGSLQKTFTNSVQLSLDDMSMTMNGQDPPMMPEIDMTLSTDMEVVVSDEYMAVAGGAPTKLRRTYDKLAMNTEMIMEMDIMGNSQNQEMPMTFTSELEGQQVDFTLDDDGSEYIASFPEGEGDEELLADLTEDMDLRGFLPSGPVAENDEWEVDAALLVNLMAPGGNLKLIPEDVDMEGMMGMNSNFGSTSDWFTEDMKGEVTATFSGTRDVDGVQVGVIALILDISNAVDLTDMVEAAMEDMELPPEAGDIEFDHMDIDIEFEGEGTLLWNLAGGHAHSLELSGDFGLLMNMGMAMSAQGMDMEIEQTMEMSGTMNQTAAFE